MKVSIITLTNNSERYLNKCIESVLMQDYAEKEYIIIDNKSMDLTLQIINEYKDKIDIVLSEKDTGLSNAMNKGLSIATGEYVIFMHSDDQFVNNNSLSNMVRELKKNAQKKWITGYLEFTNKEGIVFKKDNFFEINWKRMIIRNIIRHQACLVNTKLAQGIGFNERLKYAMDYLFFLELWNKAGSPIIITEHIAKFRIDGNNLSSNIEASLKEEFRARKMFRKSHKQDIYIIVDTFIFILRWIKVLTYHKIRYKYNS